jgi:1-deoxy-D-xylulose-5-phosphate reductoisomerase
MKKIVLLGSTGSVGKSVLDVVRDHPDKFKVIALSSNKNTDLLSEQAKEFSPEHIVIGDKSLVPVLRDNVGSKVSITAGVDAMRSVSETPDADIIFMAIAGTPAFYPLKSALEAGKTVALASKEPIVSAGNIFMQMAKQNGASIIPVDSEHSALAQCIGERITSEINTLYITGSGGSLWKKEHSQFDKLRLEDVLAHPKWNMGRKITVDSATLMNKGLEMIEARWLFNIVPEKIKVVIHPEAIIHGMVEFIDGTISAGMFMPDMKFPILRALAYPDIIASNFTKINFLDLKTLSFHAPDNERFPALDMAYSVIEEGGTKPAVLNAANEAAVNKFLSGEIRFVEIIDIVAKVIGLHKNVTDPGIEQIIDAEAWAFEEVVRSC